MQPTLRTLRRAGALPEPATRAGAAPCPSDQHWVAVHMRTFGKLNPDNVTAVAGLYWEQVQRLLRARGPPASASPATGGHACVVLAASDSEALTRALIALVRRGTSCLALQSTRNTAERSASAADHGSFSRSGALHDLLLLSMADSFVGSVSTFSHLVAEQIAANLALREAHGLARPRGLSASTATEPREEELPVGVAARWQHCAPTASADGGSALVSLAALCSARSMRCSKPTPLLRPVAEEPQQPAEDPPRPLCPDGRGGSQPTFTADGDSPCWVPLGLRPFTVGSVTSACCAADAHKTKRCCSQAPSYCSKPSSMSWEIPDDAEHYAPSTRGDGGAASARASGFILGGIDTDGAPPEPRARAIGAAGASASAGAATEQEMVECDSPTTHAYTSAQRASLERRAHSWMQTFGGALLRSISARNLPGDPSGPSAMEETRGWNRPFNELGWLRDRGCLPGTSAGSLPDALGHNDRHAFDTWRDALGPLIGLSNRRGTPSCPNASLVVPKRGEKDGLRRICALSAHAERPGCSVFSVGSRGEFSFERHLLRLTSACEVHTFDCTMGHKWNATRQLGPRLTFHPWCVSEHSGEPGPAYRTLGELAALVAGSAAVAPPSLLKMDVEGMPFAVEPFCACSPRAQTSDLLVMRTGFERAILLSWRAHDVWLPEQLFLEIHCYVDSITKRIRWVSEAEQAVLLAHMITIGYRLADLSWEGGGVGATFVRTRCPRSARPPPDVDNRA
mgnify:CR=1 FL=1